MREVIEFTQAYQSPAPAEGLSIDAFNMACDVVQVFGALQSQSELPDSLASHPEAYEAAGSIARRGLEEIDRHQGLDTYALPQVLALQRSPGEDIDGFNDRQRDHVRAIAGVLDTQANIYREQTTGIRVWNRSQDESNETVEAVFTFLSQQNDSQHRATVPKREQLVDTDNSAAVETLNYIRVATDEYNKQAETQLQAMHETTQAYQEQSRPASPLRGIRKLFSRMLDSTSRIQNPLPEAVSTRKSFVQRALGRIASMTSRSKQTAATANVYIPSAVELTTDTPTDRYAIALGNITSRTRQQIYDPVTDKILGDEGFWAIDGYIFNTMRDQALTDTDQQQNASNN